MKHLVIDLQHATSFYALFYTLAFLISFIILIVEGQRRKFPTLQWLIVIGTGFIFFVFGCRIATFSILEWQAIVDYRPLDRETGLTMLGGLLFCVPAIFVARRLVGLEDSILDAYAFVLPLGMCIQRIGCFLNGCCFGSTTSGWGVQYGPGTSPFQHHFADGFISSAAVHSLSVHPVQLYVSLGCLLAALFLYVSRKKLRSNASLFYLSGLTYYAVRFITEFFRDANAHALPVPSAWGLNTIQWLMLALIFISAIIILKKELEPSVTPEKKTTPFTFPYVIYFLFLGLVFFFGSKWLRATEILVVCLVLITTALYLGTKVFTSLTVPGLRIASLTLIFLSFVLMSQTYPEQVNSDSTLISYNTFSLGGLYGQQNFTVNQRVESGCGGPPVTIPGRQYDNTYSIAALGFSRTIQKTTDKSFTFGLSGFLGEHKESLEVRSSPAVSASAKYDVFGFNPYIQTDGRIVGFGVGAHLGDLTILEGDADTSSVKTINAYPQVYFRIGMLRTVFGELTLARNFSGSFPGTYFQTNIGFALNNANANPGAIKFGTSTSTAFFTSSYIPIGKNFVMEPYLGFGGSFLLKALSSDYDKTTGFVGSMNLHYKFGKKPVKEKSSAQK
jgi:prolipoprotein diacylglyceryltransferase